MIQALNRSVSSFLNSLQFTILEIPPWFCKTLLYLGQRPASLCVHIAATLSTCCAVANHNPASLWVYRLASLWVYRFLPYAQKAECKIRLKELLFGWKMLHVGLSQAQNLHKWM